MNTDAPTAQALAATKIKLTTLLVLSSLAEAASNYPIRSKSSMTAITRCLASSSNNITGSRVSFFPSVKNGGLICLESNLELCDKIN